MTNGFGAAFFAFSVLFVLTGLATVIGSTVLLAAGLDRHETRLPAVVLYLAGALVVPVVAVAGFGVLAMADEAPLVAGMFVALVLVPLAAVAARCVATGCSPVEILVVSGAAWSGPFMAGLALLVFFSVVLAVVVRAEPMLGQQSAIHWLVLAVLGAVAAAGAVAIGDRLREAEFASP